MVGARRGGGNQGLDEAGGHFGREHIVAVNGFADAVEQEVGIDVFQQETARADTHTFGQIVVVFGYGQHHDGLLRIAAEYLRQRFAAVHNGHVEVEQDDVGAHLLDQFDAGKAVGGFADDVEVALARQQGFDAAAE